MQVKMNKCFFLNPEKMAQIYLVKTQKSHNLIPKNDVTHVTDPKARLL